MIKKDAFQNLKGRRIYQFYLDEDTGEITDITSRDDCVQVIRCKDCKYSHEGFNSYTCERPFHPFSIDEDGFCKWAERKEK